MKNKSLQYILASLVAMFVTLPVFAATFTLSPANVSVEAGQKFDAVVTLDPQGAKNYTAKVELKYPADLLEVTSFNFGDKWVPFSKPDYDSIDNTTGILLKTAGYPGGTTSAVSLGTVSFVAKANGSGTISVGSNSQIFDANYNIFGGSSQISVVIGPVATATPTPLVAAAYTVAPTPKPIQKAVVSVSPSSAPFLLPSPVSSGAPVAAQNQGRTGLFAAIGNIVSLGTGSVWLAILVIVVVVVLVAFSLRLRKRKKQK